MAPTPLPPAASPTPSDAASAPAPTPRRRRWLAGTLAVVGVLALAVVLGVAALLWSLGNASGTAWLFAQAQRWVPGLVIVEPRGALTGDFSARRVEVPLPGDPGQPPGRMVLEGVRWSGLQVTRFALRARYAHVRFATLEADRIDVALPPSSPEKKPPPQPPTSLALPVSLDIEKLRVGEVHAAALGDKPVRDVRARIALGAEDGRLHRIDDLALAWDRLQATGAAQVATGGTMAVEARVAAEGEPADPQLGRWAASVVAKGPLARLDVAAALRSVRLPGAVGDGATSAAQAAAASAATGAPGPVPASQADRRMAAGADARRPASSTSSTAATRSPAAAAMAAVTPPPAPAEAPSVDVKATVLPFAAWPLGALQASTRALDLAALASGLPTTRLNGTATAETTAADRPVAVALDLRNDLAGRWDAGRLPVRSATLGLRARMDDPSTLDLPAIDVQLGSADRAAGRLAGSGRWQSPGWTLDLTLADLLPAELDGRAPQLRLSGPVSLRGEGFAAAASAGGPSTVSGAVSAPGPAASGDLPSRPATTAPVAPRAGLPSARPATGVPPTTAAAPAGPLPTVEIHADLAGELIAQPGTRIKRQPVRLAVDGRANARDIDVKQFIATAGRARADGSARLQRRADDAPWQVAGKATLRDFDPAPWLPTTVPAAWQRGPHRLNATAQWDVTLPPPAPAGAPSGPTTAARGPAGTSAVTGSPVSGPGSSRATTGTLARSPAQTPGTTGPAARRAPAAPGAPAASDPLAMLAALRGTASLALADSVLAGVPVNATVTLRSAEAAGRLTASVRLDAAGNTAQLDGTLDARGDGRGDRWTLAASAPAIARLAPVLRLAGLDPAMAGIDGTLAANAEVSGRWPRVSTQGTARADKLQSGGAGGLGVAHGTLRWRLGTAADAPAELDLDLTQARRGEMLVESARAQLTGTAAAHTLGVRALVRGGAPAWADAVQSAIGPSNGPTAAPVATPSGPLAPLPPPAPAGTPGAAPGPGERTLATLQAKGGLDIAGAPRWRGMLQRLAVGSTVAGRAPWMAVNGVDLDVQAEGDRTPARAAVSPGRANVLGAGLRWDRIAWQGALGREPQRLDLRAETDPLPVVPILRQMQPDFGWSGDLKVAARAVVTGSPRVHVDMTVQRVGGDLAVTDEVSTRSLGLTELRLAVNADDGVWRFTQAFAGSGLGTAAGAVTVRTTPQAFWPPPDAPMQGTLKAEVRDLSAWGGWVPAGWRIAGRAGVTADIGGRFGAPTVNGEVHGSNLGVRNVLEGIHLTDGELRIALAGDTARIERFQWRGGDGTLRIEGTSRLGTGLVPAATGPGAPPPLAGPPRADLAIVAERFRLLARVDRRVVVSGRSRLVLDGNRVELAGRYAIDEGLVDISRSDAPSLSDDVVVIRPADRPDPNLPEKKAAPKASPFAVALDLTVALGDQLRLRGRGVDTRLTGEVRVTAPSGKLAVNGSIATAEGVYAAYGQNLSIERGVITFTGAVENPRLDVRAVRKWAATDISDVQVGVLVTGTAVLPRVRLFSEPDMSDTDKLSYLVIGRPSDGLGKTDLAVLQGAAAALLAGDKESTTTKFTKAIGLDTLSLRQGSGGDLQSSIVSLGKQISARWYVGYERGLNATAGNFQLVYRLARRFTLRGQSGLDNAVDAIWTWRWQ